MASLLVGPTVQGARRRPRSMAEYMSKPYPTLPSRLVGQALIAPQGGIELAVLTDAPCPRMGITITGLNKSLATVINIWRSVDGEAQMVVRGARNLSIVDATYVVDYEAPLGRPVTYTLEIVSGLTIPPTLIATAQIDSDSVWLQDPLDPSTAVSVTWSFISPYTDIVFASSALADIGYEDPGQLVRVLGDKYPTLLGGNRLAGSGIPMDLMTRTIVAANQLRILLNAASPLLMRTIPAISPPLPALAYVYAQVNERRVSFAAGELTSWSIKGDLVKPQSLNILVATWTYANVSDLYDLYSTAAASGRSYLSWMKDPRP